MVQDYAFIKDSLVVRVAVFDSPTDELLNFLKKNILLTL